MRESIGSALLLNIVLVFSAIIILVFIGIISYSKAYRVKNRIIDIIEKYGEYNSAASHEVTESLSEAGYTVSTKDFCNSNKVKKHLREIGIYSPKNVNDNTRGYNYCVFEVEGRTNSITGSDESKYYVVVTFVHFNFPIIGDIINMPIYGETKIMGKDYSY